MTQHLRGLIWDTQASQRVQGSGALNFASIKEAEEAAAQAHVTKAVWSEQENARLLEWKRQRKGHDGELASNGLLRKRKPAAIALQWRKRSQWQACVSKAALLEAKAAVAARINRTKGVTRVEGGWKTKVPANPELQNLASNCEVLES